MTNYACGSSAEGARDEKKDRKAAFGDLCTAEAVSSSRTPSPTKSPGHVPGGDVARALSSRSKERTHRPNETAVGSAHGAQVAATARHPSARRFPTPPPPLLFHRALTTEEGTARKDAKIQAR